MKYRAFWITDDGHLEVLDQKNLPFEKKTSVLKTASDVAGAIKDMTVRGAGTIGSAAAFGIYLSCRESGGDPETVKKESEMLSLSRPTAVNLEWAVRRMLAALEGMSGESMTKTALKEAVLLSDEDRDRTEKIGQLGCGLIEEISKKKNGEAVNILTHCNAGWLGIADSGTALAPMYEAKRRGINIHVWVDETRPRNQGALTSWELSEGEIDHTYITDNAGGHLMQKGMVDIVFTGADRVTLNGDAANKIGTYLKALAAHDNGVPFYVNLPVSTIDFEMESGESIPIENRTDEEVLLVQGLDSGGNLSRIRVAAENTKALNPAFDVTPARLITGLITEKGIIRPSREALLALK